MTDAILTVTIVISLLTAFFAAIALRFDKTDEKGRLKRSGRYALSGIVSIALLTVVVELMKWQGAISAADKAARTATETTNRLNAVLGDIKLASKQLELIRNTTDELASQQYQIRETAKYIEDGIQTAERELSQMQEEIERANSSIGKGLEHQIATLRELDRQRYPLQDLMASFSFSTSLDQEGLRKYKEDLDDMIKSGDPYDLLGSVGSAGYEGGEISRISMRSGSRLLPQLPSHPKSKWHEYLAYVFLGEARLSVCITRTIVSPLDETFQCEREDFSMSFEAYLLDDDDVPAELSYQVDRSEAKVSVFDLPGALRRTVKETDFQGLYDLEGAWAIFELNHWRPPVVSEQNLETVWERIRYSIKLSDVSLTTKDNIRVPLDFSSLKTVDLDGKRLYVYRFGTDFREIQNLKGRSR